GAVAVRDPGCAAPVSVSTAVTATAQTLSSGCSESASTASLVTALTATSGANASAQCIGAKHTPGRTASSTLAGSTARPRRDRISTRSPSRTPSLSASSGCSCKNGSGLSLLSLATFPVLVMVCHW